MKLFKSAFIALSLICGLASAQDVGQVKLAKMHSLRDASSNGIIEFTPKEYEELVIQNPRPYNLINLFTVQSGCDECQLVYNELAGAAYSYRQAEDSLKVPTFFGVIYYSTKPDIKAIFTKHDFKTIPYLATSEMQQKRADGDFYSPEDLWRVKKDDAFETQQLLDHINKRFINDVPIKEPIMKVLVKNLTLFAVLVVLIRVFVSIQDFLINQWLWITIAWVGYFFCTSGIVYTILNNMPMFKMEQDQYGKAYVSEFFMRSNRGQYGGEGYITSGIGLWTSASFLIMIKADKLFKTDLSRRIAVGLCIVSGFISVATYLQCYKIKTPWYSNNFWPPEGYTRGPIMRDQGNNI